MKTSIVILTHNRLELTKQCLSSIKLCVSEPYELIVVDNASTDGTAEFLRKQPDVKVILNAKNVGFPTGCNQGARASSGENILFLNNDTVVTDSFLANMLRVLYSRSDVGFVGPVTNRIHGLQQIPVSYKDISALDVFSRQNQRDNQGKAKEVLRLVGFCLLTRKDVFYELGLFDEEFGIGTFEDDDLSLKALEAGYRLMIALDAFVHHVGSATFDNSTEIDLGALMKENYRKAKAKWGLHLPFDLLPNMDLVSMVPRNSHRLLEIGTTTGATGLELMSKTDLEIFGARFRSSRVNAAERFYSHVHSMSEIARGSLEYSSGHFDVVMIENILSYGWDPWKLVRHSTKHLASGGSVIITLPNVIHGKYRAQIIPRNGSMERSQVNFLLEEILYSWCSWDDFSLCEGKINVYSPQYDMRSQKYIMESRNVLSEFAVDVDHLSEALVENYVLHFIKK